LALGVPRWRSLAFDGVARRASLPLRSIVRLMTSGASLVAMRVVSLGVMTRDTRLLCVGMMRQPLMTAVAIAMAGSSVNRGKLGLVALGTRLVAPMSRVAVESRFQRKSMRHMASDASNSLCVESTIVRGVLVATRARLGQ
jgi:hypothetical protein